MWPLASLLHKYPVDREAAVAYWIVYVVGLYPPPPPPKAVWIVYAVSLLKQLPLVPPKAVWILYANKECIKKTTPVLVNKPYKEVME